MIIGDWTEADKHAVLYELGAVEGGGAETFMTERLEKEKAMADALHATEAAEEANSTACSAVASGVTTIRCQAVACRGAFNGPARLVSCSRPRGANDKARTGGLRSEQKRETP